MRYDTLILDGGHTSEACPSTSLLPVSAWIFAPQADLKSDSPRVGGTIEPQRFAAPLPAGAPMSVGGWSGGPTRFEIRYRPSGRSPCCRQTG